MTIGTWAKIALGIGLASGIARAQTTGTPGIGGSSGPGNLGTQGTRGGAPVTSGAIPPGAGDGEHAVRPATTPAATARARSAASAASIDDLFAGFAAESSLAEVATGRLAAGRANTTEVRRFAQRMIDDHTRAGQELATLASRRRMALPGTLPDLAKAELSALSGTPAGEFDGRYVEQQLAAHITSIGLFEAEAERGQDPQLKAWAAQTLPTLRRHADEIRALRKSPGPAGRPAAPSAR